MYSELVKQLRDNADFLVKASSGNLSNSFSETMNEAADAIEDLNKALDAVNDAREEGFDLGYWAARRDFEQRWVPVTERLPLVKGKYLCKIKCPKGEWIEIGFWNGENWYSTDWHDEISTEFVTHWMPLPQEPKEESA